MPPSLFTVAVLISINLAVINILPLPTLDGGHLAFFLIEAAWWQTPPQQHSAKSDADSPRRASRSCLALEELKAFLESILTLCDGGIIP